MNSKLFYLYCSAGDCCNNCFFCVFPRIWSWLSKKLTNSFLNKSKKEYKLVLRLELCETSATGCIVWTFYIVQPCSSSAF